jgi:hypothetical protein
MTLILALVTLVLAPWHGASLPTASSDAVKFKLTVYGAAAQHVELRAAGVPKGWVASFCTKTLCSPLRYSMDLNGRGIGVVEFAAIRTGESAPKHAQMTVTADGAKSLNVRV